MDSENIILVVVGLASAFGIKEIWSIVKKKMDINHSISSSQSNYKQKELRN